MEYWPSSGPTLLNTLITNHLPASPFLVMAARDQSYQVPESARLGSQLTLTPANTHNSTTIANTKQPQKKRASRPKVRTGCTTCKIRRVKCDETKPNCKRCTSTGRKCDGYEFTRDQPSSSDVSRPPLPDGSRLPPPEAQARRSQLILPSSLSVTLPGNARERRIFHRFQTCTIPAFAGASELEFWNSLVLKAGQEEPVVRNAIVALGTLHEDYQKRNGKYSQDMIADPSYQQALSLYGKALRQLNERLCEGTRSTAKLALMSSILFTCFEVLRRNSMAAIIHYQAGLRELIRQIKTSREDEAASLQFSSAITEFRPAPQDEMDILLRVFARYDVQASTFARLRPQSLAVDLPLEPPPFSNLTQVKMHLDNLLISVYQFIKSDLSMYRYWKSENVPSDWLLRRDDAIVTFETWLTRIESYFQQNYRIISRPSEMKNLLGLRMQVKIAIILLKTCIDSGAESSFDTFLVDFDDIVTRIEELANTLELREALPLENESISFTMELGILHPLFFVATRCRDATIRRRAIAVLKRGGREGVWEGPIVALVAQRVVEIEEALLHPDQVVPEANRIHATRMIIDYEGRQVSVEMDRSIDLEQWKRWEVVREVIRF
jgi:Fungal specific transcription factor domain/Fungal Zn(2)-Cys(6) binuclear cluster domain